MDIIFDVDGTLLDIQHRVHLIRPTNGAKKDWEAFRNQAHLDSPHEDIIAIAQALSLCNHRILISSGRMFKEYTVTAYQLKQFGMVWERMYMRANNDVRTDHIVKLEMLAQMRMEGFNPVMAFDDRQQVVDMWRAAGLRCLQVAPGDF